MDRIEYNKQLIERYPFLRPRNAWTGKLAEDYDFEYTWADDIPLGWYAAFGEEMFEELRNELIRCNYLYDYQIIQIKEKYGSLRIYDNGIPTGCKVWDIIRKYESLSARTCVKCGKPATKISTGWICPWCDDCINQERADDYVDIKEWFED